MFKVNFFVTKTNGGSSTLKDDIFNGDTVCRNCNNDRHCCCGGIVRAHDARANKKNVKGVYVSLNKFRSQGKAPESQPSQCRSYSKHAMYHLISRLSFGPAHRPVSWAWTCRIILLLLLYSLLTWPTLNPLKTS